MCCVLMQMAVARAEHQEGTFKGPVVVLADKDKAEMDAAVAKGLQGSSNMEVYMFGQHMTNHSAHRFVFHLIASYHIKIRM